MDDLLDAMMGGGQSQKGEEDPLGGLLEGLIGGSSGQGGADALGGLLEGMLGGAAGAQATPGGQMPQGGGLMDILGAVLGGGGASQLGGDPNLMPFTEALSEKLGISPQMASVLIGAAMTLLMGMLQESAQEGKGMPDAGDLDHLLDEDFISSSGAVAQVAEQTGLDEETAAHHLREAMVMITNQPAPEAAPRRPASGPTELDGLLDSWEVDS
jgi:hypothetical protein